jgi:RNA polymerase sigma-70 factor (ECF subfamily)
MSKRRVSSARQRARGDDLPDPRAQLSGLFENEFDGVYRFCLARTGCRSLAEEAVSETFADAARMFASGRGAQVTHAWLLAVARNRVIDQWRTNERHRRRIDRLRQAGSDPGLSPDVPGGRIDDQRVLAALNSLPERQRAALTMRYLDELSVDEVADTLQVGYRAAESLLARGRRGFIRAYEELR